MDEAFGAVQAGPDIEGVIELSARLNGPAAVYEFNLRVSRLVGLKLMQIVSWPNSLVHVILDRIEPIHGIC